MEWGCWMGCGRKETPLGTREGLFLKLFLSVAETFWAIVPVTMP